jgi:hypothetical protein
MNLMTSQLKNTRVSHFPSMSDESDMLKAETQRAAHQDRNQNGT